MFYHPCAWFWNRAMFADQLSTHWLRTDGALLKTLRDFGNSSLNVYCAPSSKTTPKPNESEFYCYVWLWRGVIWATGGSFYKYLPSHLCWYTCWTSWMHQYWISSALPEGQSNSEAHPVTCTHYQQCSREYAGRGGKHVIATASSKPAAQHSLWFHQYLKHLSEGSWVTECHNTELKTIQMSLLLK